MRVANAVAQACAPRLGAPLPHPALRQIEKRLHLDLQKWDTQAGDRNVLSAQPLILASAEWKALCDAAESLAEETVALEAFLMATPEARAALGIPKAIWKCLPDTPPRRGPRVMRFDFHPTADGWLISEINSDVPGGWLEASALPKLYQPFCGGLELPPDPLAAWRDAMRTVTQQLASEEVVALLHAPGYLEDQQVVRTFAGEIHALGKTCTMMQTPAALEWSPKGCALRATGTPVGLVIRFYQGEWLCNLPDRTGWQKLLSATDLPVVNPTVSLVSESKRFPLVLREASGYPCWRAFAPECRDPREIDSADWEQWVLKAAHSNTGDEVHICATMVRAERTRLVRQALRKPLGWVAQRRFETLPIESCRGSVYPCVGVFVVGGRASGAYVRLSAGPVTDGGALEAPLLIDGADDCDD